MDKNNYCKIQVIESIVGGINPSENSTLDIKYLCDIAGNYSLCEFASRGKAKHGENVHECSAYINGHCVNSKAKKQALIRLLKRAVEQFIDG
jgi:hypothetical protein